MMMCTEDLDRGAMTYPSPAEPYLKPAAAGVQALSMNSLRSAWTPVLAGLKRFHYAGEGKSEAYALDLYSLSDWYKISVRSAGNTRH